MIKKYFDIFQELAKVRITVFVAVSTTVGYILSAGQLDLELLIPTLGVFLLASGSSVFNHIQESETDAKMNRTKYRPIPSGRITPWGAFLFAMVLVVSGSILLYDGSNLLGLELGWLALFWYNAVYTPLKKKHALAVIPGSVIGAIPPVIGWVAANGNPLAPEILALALFFFIWQIPHFWLLLLIYHRDYQKAGFPTLSSLFSDIQLSRITFIWIVALAISVLLIPSFSISSSVITVILLIGMGVWLTIQTKNILSAYFSKLIFKKAFLQINIYVLLVVFLLSIDKLLLTQF